MSRAASNPKPRAKRAPVSQTDALDRLAEQVKAARATAMRAEIFGRPLADLRDLAEAHTRGTSATGWRNPYPAGDPRSLYLEYQFNLHHDDSRFKAALQARQTGKDFTSEGEVVETCKAGVTEWMIAAPSERQALDSLDQAKLWAEAWDFRLADLQLVREGGSETLLKAAEITFSNGSRARAVPGRPDTVRGRSTNVLLTEFDFFDNPAETWRAIVPSITNPLRGGEKRLRVVSTPNGKDGQMAKIFDTTGREGRRFDWSRHLVTIYHAVLCGLPVNIAQMRELFDDPEGWAQEFECEFLDTSNVLLPYEILTPAESIDATEVIGPDFWTTEGGGPVVCGVDFGRQNDPTVCWTLQLVGDVWITREVLVLRGMPTPQQEEILRVRLRRATRTAFDYTGPGIGLGDYLVKAPGIGEYKPEAHKLGKLELCTFTSGFKRVIFPRLRRAFEAPLKVRTPVSIAIREDLHAMKQIVRNNQYSYAAPRTAEGHSDRCTALALALHAGATAGVGAGSFTAADLRAVHLGLPAVAGPLFTRTALRF